MIQFEGKEEDPEEDGREQWNFADGRRGICASRLEVLKAQIRKGGSTTADRNQS